jgi:hypothetical protein
MKIYPLAAALLILGSIGLRAQDMSGISARSQPATSSPSTAHDITGFSAPGTVAPALSTESSKTPPNPHPDLRPRLGGIFTDGLKYGAVMIAPGAPAEYGMGEKYLSAPSQTYDLQHETGPAAHRDSGGFKLFTFEF